MGRFKIVHRKCQVEFIVSQVVVVLLPVSEPCQLQKMASLPVSQVYDDKAPVLRFLSPHLLKAQRFLIKAQRPVQIRNIKIVVGKLKLQIPSLLCIFIHILRWKIPDPVWIFPRSVPDSPWSSPEP